MIELDTIELAVIAVVKREGDPLLTHILHASETQAYTQHTIEHKVGRLCRLGVLRMKEDLIDHDWSYRLNSSWADAEIAKLEGAGVNENDEKA